MLAIIIKPAPNLGWQILCITGLIILLGLAIYIWLRWRGKRPTGLTVTPLDYETVLTLEEARARLAEVEQAFKDVKSKYSQPQGNISEEDNKLLGECIGVLLPLTMQPCIQQEFKDSDPENSIFIRCSELQQKILLFVAGFENSGVQVFWTDEPFGF